VSLSNLALIRVPPGMLLAGVAMLIRMDVTVVVRGRGAVLFLFMPAAVRLFAPAAVFLFAAAAQFLFGLRHGGTAAQHGDAGQRDHEPAAKPTTR
jgi:hypothetical protein